MRRYAVLATFIAALTVGGIWYRPLWFSAVFVALTTGTPLLEGLCRKLWPPQHEGGLRDYARDVFAGKIEVD